MHDEIIYRARKLFNLARQQHIEWQDGLAVATLKQVIVLGESYKSLAREPVLADAYKLLGLIHAWTGDDFGAVKSLEKALELGVEKTHAMSRALGGSYFYLGWYDEALEPLREALRFNERDANVRFALGVSYLKVSEHHNNYTVYKMAALEQCEALKTLSPSMCGSLQALIENSARQATG